MNLTSTRSTEQMPQVAQAPKSRELTSMVPVAFFAILRRDFRLALNDLTGFLALILLQPLFYLFVFGKVLPNIGATTPSFTATLFGCCKRYLAHGLIEKGCNCR